MAAASAFPSAPDTGLTRAFGLLGLALLALSLASSRAGQNIGVGVMLLALLWRGRRAWSELWPDWVFRMLLLWLAYVVVRAIWAAVQTPALAGAQFESLHFDGRILYVPLVGWWMGGSARSVRTLALLVLLGLLIGVGLNLNWQHPFASMQLGSGWLHARKGFGMNAQHTGLICVVALAGMIAYLREWVGPAGQARELQVLRAVAWVAVAAFVFQVMIVSGTRAAWLGGLIVALAAAGIYLSCGLRAGGRRGWRALGLVGVAALVLGLGIGMNSGGVVQRMTQDAATYSKILRGRDNQIHSLDIGSRFYLWRWGFRKWLQRPVFGWGPGSRRSMIKHSDMPQYVRERFDHLHNSYLELAFALGLIGLLLYLAIWALLVRRVWRGMRAGYVPANTGWFLLAAVALFALASVTEAYVVVQVGWSLTGLLGGAMFALGRADGPGLDSGGGALTEQA